MALHQPQRRTFGDPYGVRTAKKEIEIQNLPMRLFGLAEESFVDGPGIRFAVFVQGCPHHCEGCHNPESHDPAGGVPSSVGELWSKIDSAKFLDGVTFSGGEPFTQAAALAELGRLAHNKGMSVMTYTGWTYETIVEMAKTDSAIHDLLSVTDILVDGPFVLKERDLTLRFRGSRNQRALDISGYPQSAEIKPMPW